jgi:transcriptional regulator with XRE-family HTH domain
LAALEARRVQLEAGQSQPRPGRRSAKDVQQDERRKKEAEMEGLNLNLNPTVVAERLRQVVADEPKAFAYDIGVSLSAVYNYLNGRIPSTEVLFRIARHTGRPMEWFLDCPAVEASLEQNRNAVAL